MKGLIIIVIHCVLNVKGLLTLSSENTTSELVELNFTNQLNTIYENVTDTTMIMPITTTSNEKVKVVLDKIDVRQEVHIDERISSLTCDMPQLPVEYRIWKGNETNEMLIPKKVFYFNIWNESIKICIE